MLAPDLRQIRRTRLILLGLWLLFYCSVTLFTPPLLDDADSVHAEVAREMLLRHDFVTLYANGIRYLEKAPLFYWLMAASMRLLGATTAASRLPLALSVLGLTLLIESFARRAFASSRAGLYAGLITLSSFGIFIFSRINIPDILVCFFLCTALYAYYLTEQDIFRLPSIPASLEWMGTEGSRPSLTLCLTFAAACALNILTKGLIGIVFPIAIVGLHLLLTRGFRGALTRLKQFHPAASVATFLILAVPWHVLIALANPGHGHPGGLTRIGAHWQIPYPTDGNVHGWAWFYFLNEQLYRYLNLRVPHDYDTSPLWLFLGLIFIWLLPWSAFLPSAIARTMPLRSADFRLRLRTQTLTSTQRTDLLLLLWAFLPLAFFTFSTRQEYYVLPALPPIILLIAALLGQGNEQDAPHLTSEMSAVSATNSIAAADAYLRDHLPEAIAEYRRRNTYGGTLSISSDAARELLPSYSTPTERMANTLSLSPASSVLAQEIWDRTLRARSNPARYVVEFLTGSPGSGKTSSFIEVEAGSPIAIIREGMMDHFALSAANIQQAIDAGFVPVLQLVFVSDPRITIRRAVARAMEHGRTVPVSQMARLYLEIPANVERLRQHFGDQLGMKVYNNSFDGRPPTPSSISEALSELREYTIATVEEAMRDELEAIHSAGRASDAVYRGFAGASATTHATAGSRTVRPAINAGLDRSHREDQSRREGPRAIGIAAPSAALLVLGTLISLGLTLFLLRTKAPTPDTDLATLLQQNPADYALSFGHFLDLNAQALGLFRLPLALTAIAFFFGPLAHWLLRRRARPHAATLALAAATFIFLSAAWLGLRTFSPTITSAQLAGAIRPQLHPGDLLAIHGEYEAGSTLGFYLRRNDIHIIEGRSSNLWYGSFFPDAPSIFETRQSIARKWLGPERIFLWQDPHDPDRPPLDLPAPVYLIASSGGKQILSNQPNR